MVVVFFLVLARVRLSPSSPKAVETYPSQRTETAFLLPEPTSLYRPSVQQSDSVFLRVSVNASLSRSTSKVEGCYTYISSLFLELSFCILASWNSPVESICQFINTALLKLKRERRENIIDVKMLQIGHITWEPKAE